MKSTEHWLVHEHTQFELLLRSCRGGAETEDWNALDSAFKELVSQLKYHMAQEEEVLFPAFEEKPGISGRPTLALRNEHSVIVQMFRDTALVIKTRDAESILESLVYLESLMQKHHEKEEDIFIPLASHILFDEREELCDILSSFSLNKLSRQWNIP